MQIFHASEEAEYPKLLCQLVAGIVSDLAVKAGAVLPSESLETPLVRQSGSRLSNQVSSGKQPRGRKLPQLISEHCEIWEMDSATDDPSLKLLRHYFKTADDGTQQSKFVYGKLRTPADFIKTASTVQHPFDSLSDIGDELKNVLINILSCSPSSVISKRAQNLKFILNKAKELEPEESKLEESIPTHLKPILSGKRLALMDYLLKQLD